MKELKFRANVMLLSRVELCFSQMVGALAPLQKKCLLKSPRGRIVFREKSAVFIMISLSQC